jgi:FkbM family methyltransferase
VSNHIRIKARAFLSYELFERRSWPPVIGEKISKRLAVRHLPRNPVIVDCGAYDGGDSIVLSRLTKGTVHAFEADPQIFKKLVHNTRHWRNVICHPLALSDKDGTAKFNCCRGDLAASGSLLIPGDQMLQSGNVSDVVTVSTRTLSTWMSEMCIPKIDMLWLDMQGMELRALQASVSEIKRVSVIHTEVSLTRDYSDACLYRELREFLSENGFDVVCEAIPPGWSSGNVLFVRRHMEVQT